MRMMFRAMMFAVLVALASSSSSYAVLGERGDAVNNVKEYAAAIDTGSADTDSYKYDGWMTIAGLNNLDEESRMAFILFLENIRLVSKMGKNTEEYEKFKEIIDLFNVSRERNGHLDVFLDSDNDNVKFGAFFSYDLRQIRVSTNGVTFKSILEKFFFELCNSANYTLGEVSNVIGNPESYGVMTEVIEMKTGIYFKNILEKVVQTEPKVLDSALRMRWDVLHPSEQKVIEDAEKTWYSSVYKQPPQNHVPDSLYIPWQMGHTHAYIDFAKSGPVSLRKRLEDRDPNSEEQTLHLRQEGRKLSRKVIPNNILIPELKKAADEARRYFYQPTHRKDDLGYIKRNEKLDQIIPSDIRLLQIRMDEIKRHTKNVSDVNFLLAAQKFLDNIQWALSRDLAEKLTMNDLEEFKKRYETDGLDTLVRDNDAGMKGVIAREALAMPAPKPEEKVQDLTKGIEDRISEIQRKLGEGGAKNFADFMNRFLNKTYTEEEKKRFMGDKPYFFKKGDGERLLAFLEKLGAIKNMTAMDITENVTRNIEKMIAFMRALRSGNVIRASEKLMAEIEDLMNAVVGYVTTHKKGEMDEEELKDIYRSFKNLLDDNGILVDERIGNREGKSIVQTLIEKGIPEKMQNLNNEERKALNAKIDLKRQRIEKILARPDVIHFMRLLSGETVDINQKLAENKIKNEKRAEKERELMKKIVRIRELREKSKDAHHFLGGEGDEKNVEAERDVLEGDLKKLKREFLDLGTGMTQASMAFEKQASVMSFLNKVLNTHLSEKALKNFHALLWELETPGRARDKRIFYSIMRIYLFLAYYIEITSSSLINANIGNVKERLTDVMQELEKQFSRPVRAVEIGQMIQDMGLKAKQVSVLEEQEVAKKMSNQQDLSIKSIMAALNSAINAHEAEL